MNDFTLEIGLFCILNLFLLPQSLRFKSKSLFFAVSSLCLISSPYIYSFDDVAELSLHENVPPMRALFESLVTGNVIPDYWVGYLGFSSSLFMSLSLISLLYITHDSFKHNLAVLAPGFISPAFLFLLRGQVQQLVGFVAAYFVFIRLYNATFAKIKRQFVFILVPMIFALPYALSQLVIAITLYSFIRLFIPFVLSTLSLQQVRLSNLSYLVAGISLIFFCVFLYFRFVQAADISNHYVINKLFYRYSMHNQTNFLSISCDRPFSPFGSIRIFSMLPFLFSIIMYVFGFLVSIFSKKSSSFGIISVAAGRRIEFIYLLFACFALFLATYTMDLPQSLDRLIATSSIFLAYISVASSDQPTLVSNFSFFISIPYTFFYFSAISANIST